MAPFAHVCSFGPLPFSHLSPHYDNDKKGRAGGSLLSAINPLKLRAGLLWGRSSSRRLLSPFHVFLLRISPIEIISRVKPIITFSPSLSLNPFLNSIECDILERREKKQPQVKCRCFNALYIH